MSNAPGMTYFDNFLNPEALHALRRFLMESTIWYAFKYPGGYLGAMLVDGMACPLLFQIADELRQTLPGIFKHHPLNQLWAYKYDSQANRDQRSRRLCRHQRKLLDHPGFSKPKPHQWGPDRTQERSSPGMELQCL